MHGAAVAFQRRLKTEVGADEPETCFLSCLIMKLEREVLECILGFQ
jgi:hypothetical protein